MRNALIVMLAVSLLIVRADGAAWRLAQNECGDPDEYQSSRWSGWIETSHRYLELGLCSFGVLRIEGEQQFKEKELKRDSTNNLKEKHQEFVINFSGSLFFLER